MQEMHLEALPKQGRDTAGKLGRLPWLEDFYLAGGTALALLFGHRISVDLDFFSQKNTLGFSERQRAVADLISLRAQIEEEKEGTVHIRCQNTHVSFFRYAYPLLRPTTRWEGLQIAHPEDIALMKMGAIIGRGSKKDFFDLYVLLHEGGLSLPKLFRRSKKKFEGSRDFQLQALRAMVYFDDAEREPDPRLIKKLSWPEVKRFFEREVRSHLKGKM